MLRAGLLLIPTLTLASSVALAQPTPGYPAGVPHRTAPPAHWDVSKRRAQLGSLTVTRATLTAQRTTEERWHM